MTAWEEEDIRCCNSTSRRQSMGRGWREMTPSAEPCCPHSTRLFDARQKPNSNHEPAQVYVLCMYVRVRPGTRGPLNGHPSQAAGLQQQHHHYLRAYRCMRSMQLRHHRRPVRRQTGGRPGRRAAGGFPAVFCCCCCSWLLCRYVGEISAIPPHPQITAVQKSHCPLPTHGRGWHSEPSPSGRIAGVVCAGGIRMTSGLFWGRTHLLLLALYVILPSCSLGAESTARWLVCWCVCAPGFGFGDKAKPTDRPRACNTKRTHRAENRHPCCPCLPSRIP